MPRVTEKVHLAEGPFLLTLCYTSLKGKLGHNRNTIM